MVLYSNGCPRCRQLENLLMRKKINYVKSGAFDELQDRGFMTVPVLKIDNNFLNFDEAVQFINERE